MAAATVAAQPEPTLDSRGGDEAAAPSPGAPILADQGTRAEAAAAATTGGGGDSCSLDDTGPSVAALCKGGSTGDDAGGRWVVIGGRWVIEPSSATNQGIASTTHQLMAGEAAAVEAETGSASNWGTLRTAAEVAVAAAAEGSSSDWSTFAARLQMEDSDEEGAALGRGLGMGSSLEILELKEWLRGSIGGFQ